MQIKKSLKIFYCCLFFIVGIAFGEFLKCDWFVFICLSGGLSAIAVFLQKYRFVFLCFGLIVFGCFWNNFFNPRIDKNHISFYNNQQKFFIGRIVDDPVNQGSEQSFSVVLENFRGKVLVKKELYPVFRYGDLLALNCMLVQPKSFEGFRYDKFLARSGIYSLCYNPTIKLIDSNQGNFLLSKIFSFKSFLLGRLNQTISEPQAALLSGILLGVRASLPEKLSDQFNRVGITHIIAISGFNITILVVVLLNLAKHFYINRKKATWLVLLFLCFFVVLTGASGSVVRAGIMGGLVVFAKYLGRKSAIRNVLVLSAAMMLFFNPKILLWDAGFQLSFLSTIGLIYLSPVLVKYFQRVPEFFSLRENLISTVSAIIITLPLILFNFGRFSVVAPIVNVLILPTIPIIMFLGFLQLFFSVFSSLIGSIIGWGSWFFLTYIIKIVEKWDGFPFASFDIRIPLWCMILFYFFIVIVFLRRSRRELSTFASDKKI